MKKILRLLRLPIGGKDGPFLPDRFSRGPRHKASVKCKPVFPEGIKILLVRE